MRSKLSTLLKELLTVIGAICSNRKLVQDVFTCSVQKQATEAYLEQQRLGLELTIFSVAVFEIYTYLSNIPLDMYARFVDNNCNIAARPGPLLCHQPSQRRLPDL